MLKFNPGQAPYKYHFVDPDTGHRYEAKSKLELIAYIRNYRSQNMLEEIDYLDMAVEDYLCRLPENAGKCQQVPLKRGFFEWASGAFNVVKQVFYGDKNMVDQETAEKRAAVCVDCKYNVFPDKDLFIDYSDRLAEAMTGGRKVSLHDKLGNCDICTCCNKGKVWFKGPFQLKESWKKAMKEVGCWQLKELTSKD